MVQNNLPDFIGVDQLRRRNALADMEMQVSQQNAENFQRSTDLNAQRQQMQIDSDQQSEALEFVRSGIANLSAAASDPVEFSRVADVIASDPRAARIGIKREEITPESVAQLRVLAQMAPPEKAVPFEQTAEFKKIQAQNAAAIQLERQRAASAERLERLRQSGNRTAAPQAPAGYRFKPDGSMEPVPGGPADIKLNPPKKLSDAKDVLDIIAIAEPLLDKATGSYIGTGIDRAAQAFGASTEGGVAISQLKALQAALMLKMPRMEGPQSNLDVQLYREAAGTIGDPTVPVENKRAALEVVKQMNERYSSDRRSSGASGTWKIEEIR
jgi:hypothetical protein